MSGIKDWLDFPVHDTTARYPAFLWGAARNSTFMKIGVQMCTRDTGHKGATGEAAISGWIEETFAADEIVSCRPV